MSLDNPAVVWAAFFCFSGVIVLTGPRLSRYGDVIAEKTRLGRNWIGVVLLALVTSLPEVATSASAAVLSLPDVVFGNVFGSNLFNLIIIGVLDFVTRKGPVLHLASRNHLITSSYGTMMMALALLPMILYNFPGLGFEPVKLLGFIDASSLLIIFLYIAGIRHIFLREQTDSRERTAPIAPDQYQALSAGRTALMFTFFALLIVLSGIGLSILADRISTYRVYLLGQSYEIGQSMVGIVLIAVVTSLPELMVSIGAARIGAVDMAVGNVLGSNMFNMLIIGIADFFYPAGSLLNRPTIVGAARLTGLASHLVTGLTGIILTALVAATLSRRARARGRFGLTSPLLFVIFLFCYFLLFRINFS